MESFFLLDIPSLGTEHVRGAVWLCIIFHSDYSIHFIKLLVNQSEKLGTEDDTSSLHAVSGVAATCVPGELPRGKNGEPWQEIRGNKTNAHSLFHGGIRERVVNLNNKQSIILREKLVKFVKVFWIKSHLTLFRLILRQVYLWSKS